MNDNGCGCEGSCEDNENCNGGSCSSGNCGSQQKSFIEKTHELNKIKKVIGIVGGKGGVGKTLVTSLMSVMMKRKGYKVGVLDADITGPSIPKIFGIDQKATGSELGIFPSKSKTGINLMSINLMLDKEDSPVIWRGPMIGGIVKQFWTDVLWGELDFLFLDMPPGTGDVPLTVFQSIPLDGIIIVTSPQELVGLIVKKAYNMAKEMNIPILGIVENMSYMKCPDCGKEISIFGKSRVEETASQLGIEVLGRIPVDPAIAELCDKGEIEAVNTEFLSKAISKIEDNFQISKETNSMKIAIATEGNNVSSHFGKCENFTIVELENSKVINEKVISTVGNQHGLLPGYLKQQGVDVVIAGGMGDGARENLVSSGIEIISGITGNIKDAINNYIKGELRSLNSGCSGHGQSHSPDHGGSGCSCGHH